MDIRYTNSMAKKVRELGLPVKDFGYTIVEYPEFLTVRVYENNVLQYSDEQRAAIMAFLLKVRETLESFGVRCEIEGVQGDIPRR